jgi:hypothetical protein
VIHLKPATDSHAAITSVSATRIGDNQPLQYNQPTFIWYNFTATVPAKIGFSSFTVDISKSGNSTIYDNGGGGFPLDPEILPLPSLSCGVSNGSEYKLNVTAAVSLLLELSIDSSLLILSSPYLLFRFLTRRVSLQLNCHCQFLLGRLVQRCRGLT